VNSARVTNGMSAPMAPRSVATRTRPGASRGFQRAEGLSRICRATRVNSAYSCQAFSWTRALRFSSARASSRACHALR
jgi:hypothetical protein